MYHQLEAIQAGQISPNRKHLVFFKKISWGNIEKFKSIYINKIKGLKTSKLFYNTAKHANIYIRVQYTRMQYFLLIKLHRA